MPSYERFKDPLSFDVANDLKRVDQVLTQILKDRAVWSEFVRDPNGVLTRLGLHPPTSPEINERANRIFYATLTNTNLIELILKHYKEFRPSDEEKYRKISQTAAENGVIEHAIELDLETFYHLLEQPGVLREALRFSLHDLNEKGILQQRHKREEIDAYIERLIEATRHRLPIADHPKLEVWDSNYGIGLGYGGPFAELGAGTTVAVAVEVALAGTNAVVVFNVVEFWGPTPVITAASVATGDEKSVRALAIVGRLLDFSAELFAYVNNFERRRQSP